MRKKHSALKIFLLVFLCVLLTLLLVYASMMYIIPAFEQVDRTVVENTSSWMSRLDDSLLLNEIILPGTHDSASNDVQLAFFSKCQDLSVEEQLNAGFRYLDIRLELDGDGFRLMHGFAACKTSGWPFADTLRLDSVLEQCYCFLAEHPTECILFAVKQEHGSEPVEQFETQLNAIIGQNASNWLLTDRFPTLGEARGKMILLRRYDDRASLGAIAGIPLLWSAQGVRDDPTLHAAAEQNDFYTLLVQDRYKYDAEEKWQAFVNGLSCASESDAELALHFLSTNGSPAFGHPYKYAADLNQRLLTEQTPMNGWIVIDFGSAQLAEQIFSKNFR